MAEETLLFVYSDIVGSLWANRFDLHRTAGELRSAVYNECLKNVLPLGSSSAHLNIYYVSDGVAYEPEETFRRRLRHCINAFQPQKIGITTELSHVVGEMHRGHVHLIMGFPDRPLVTLPADAEEATFPSTASTSGANTMHLNMTVDSDDLDARITDGSSSGNDETQPSEVNSASSFSACRTDYLELLSPSFAFFISLAHAVSHPEDEVFIARASQLVEDRLVNASTDLQDAETVGLALSELLQPAEADMYRTHHEGMVSTFCRIEDEDIQVSAPFLVLQAANVRFGPTGGDTLVQSAIRACDEDWVQKHREMVRSVTCCPVFAVMYSRSSLSVYGSAFTHKWVCQELTQPRMTSNIGTVARLLWALRQSVLHLQQWYRTMVLASEYPQFYNRLHPASTFVKDPSGASVRFYYLRRIEPHDKVFLAFAIGEHDHDRMYVVKFTPRYSAEAHRLLAAANCAPDLVYCGSPYPEFPGYARMQMVITEYVPSGLTMWEVARKPLRDKLREAVGLLHSQGMVHGDLRWPNVLVDREGDIRLIDFDWAGVEGEARYPDDLAEDVPWPAGAEPGALITKEHDKCWLERLFKPRERM